MENTTTKTETKKPTEMGAGEFFQAYGIAMPTAIMYAKAAHPGFAWREALTMWLANRTTKAVR